MGSDRRLVLTVSIGDRPWFHVLRPSMEAFARRWQADFCVVSELHVPEAPDHDEDLRCRMEKIDAIYRALGDYRHILYLDDTVFIRPGATLPTSDLEEGPTPSIWATVEQPLWIPGYLESVAEAFSYYEVPTDKPVVFSSGIMVLRTEHRVLFDLSQGKPMRRIGVLADQFWVSARRQRFGFPLRDLGPKYNFVGSYLSGRSPAPIPIESAQFFHITRGAGNSEERLAFANMLVERFAS
jgi:hypothetical protein